MDTLRSIVVLVVVFIIGIAIGSVASTGSKSQTSTLIRSQTTILIQPQTATLTDTLTEATIVTKTQISTLPPTTTVTMTSLRTGAVLVSYSGSEDASGPPFTAATASVQINLNITARTSLTEAAVTWNIYQVGASTSACYGSVLQQQGSFIQYCNDLSVGTEYYVSMVTNTNWQFTVTEIT